MFILIHQTIELTPTYFINQVTIIKLFCISPEGGLVVMETSVSLIIWCGGMNINIWHISFILGPRKLVANLDFMYPRFSQDLIHQIMCCTSMLVKGSVYFIT